jgi:hypothetical protein
VTRGLFVLLVVALSACGRTQPVKGLRERLPNGFEVPDDGGSRVPDGGFTTDGGQIISGLCQGLAQSCPRGFHCESGQCVLNGATGELQVTLQWQNTPRTADDLDLHLVEPAGNGTCEIYYGTGGLFSCQPVGSLDLDANASCVDTAGTAGLAFDTENIIYPPGRSPPVGHYLVRVDYWSECVSAAQVPFVVTVRKGTMLTQKRGVFHMGESDNGSQGSGITMLEFDMP